MAVMYNYCGATEQMRACVSRYDKSPELPKFQTKLELMHILQAQVCSA